VIEKQKGTTDPDATADNITIHGFENDNVGKLVTHQLASAGSVVHYFLDQRLPSGLEGKGISRDMAYELQKLLDLKKLKVSNFEQRVH